MGPVVGTTYWLHVAGLFVSLLFVLNVRAADTGDEFSNNFATDIAPLLALFGEQVVKQYLSDSLGWRDNLIFALAPLGIITAIVSAIRVGGAGWLRAIIGRARESRGAVEIEILSSTSADVCELWNGQTIVRVLGTPSLIELVLCRDAQPGSNDGVLDGLVEDNDEYEMQSPNSAEHGIYSIDGAMSKGLLGAQSNPQRIGSEKFRDFIMLYGGRTLLGWRWRIRDAFQPLFPRRRPWEIELQDWQSSPPNLSLNITGRRVKSKILSAICVVGVIIQSLVLIFAGLQTFSKRWKANFKKSDRLIGPYAFPLMITGTTFLGLGMFLCSLIIDRHSLETEWVPKKPGVKMVWLQKGAVISDQKYDSYAFTSDDNHKLVKSLSLGNQEHFQTLTVIASAFSLIGFVVQFSALRFLHWSITIAQLTAIAIMTILRAFIRKNLGSKPPAEELPDGYELDSMSKKLTDCQSWKIVPLKSSSSLPQEQDGFGTTVFEVRNRLQTLSKWSGRWQKSAESLANAIEIVMNSSFRDYANLKDPSRWSNEAEFIWTVTVKTKKTEESNSVEDNLRLRLKRSRIDRMRWSQWYSNPEEIEALIGLWMHTIDPPGDEQLLPGRERATDERTLFLHSTSETASFFGQWLPSDLEYSVSIDRESKVEELKLPQSHVFGIVDPEVDNEKHLSIVLKNSASEACTQAIFSMFLHQITEHLNPIDDGLIQSSGMNFHSYGMVSPKISKLVEDIQECGFAIIDKTFANLIPIFQASCLLPTSTDETVLFSVLKRMNILQETGESTAAQNLLLWIVHDLETTSRRHRSNLALRRARAVYSNFLAACEKAFEPGHRLRDEAARQLNTFDDCFDAGRDGRMKANTSAISAEVLKSQAYHPLLLSAELTELWGAAVTGDLAALEQIEPDDTLDVRDAHGRTPLIEAASGGREAVVKMLLDRRFSVTEKDRRGQTALHSAVEKQHLEVCQLLLIEDQDVLRYPDETGQTPYSLGVIGKNDDIINMINFYDPEKLARSQAWASAIQFGNTPLFHLLVNTQKDQEMKNEHGQAALSVAAVHGNLDIIKEYCANGADMEATDNFGQTPLMLAAEFGCDQAVQYFLKINANLESKTTESHTPLTLAAKNGNERVVKLLVEAGANIEASTIDNETSLTFAASLGYDPVVKILLEHNAHLETGYHHRGETPLIKAIVAGHNTTVKLLLEHSVNTLVNTNGGKSLFHFIITRRGQYISNHGLENKDDQESVSMLERNVNENTNHPIEHRVGLPYLDDFHTPTLSMKLYKSFLGTLKLLLEYGVHGQNEIRFLDISCSMAVVFGDFEAVRVLLENGADPEFRYTYTGEIWLISAASSGFDKIVKLLLLKGANCERMNKRRQTALYLASGNGHLQTVRCLLEHGANPRTRSEFGRLSVDIAKRKGHGDIVALLRSWQVKKSV